MAVTIKRARFAGTWFSDAEYRALTTAARLVDLSIAAFVRRAAVTRAHGVLRKQAAQREREAARTRGGVAASIVRDVFAATTA